MDGKLTADELTDAQTRIDLIKKGTQCRLPCIYGEDWENVKIPTTFGMRFKKSVRTRELTNIKFVDRSTANHSIYEIT
jgi:hypothetical protein